MSRWDLARARSQQPARKYKVCGPVGPTPDQLEAAKWVRALEVTRKAMLARPDFDAVICSPQDAERLKVLGLRILPSRYARKGEWSLSATMDPGLAGFPGRYRCAQCQLGLPCTYELCGLKSCDQVTL